MQNDHLLKIVEDIYFSRRWVRKDAYNGGRRDDVFIFRRTQQIAGNYSSHISRVRIENFEKYLAKLDFMAENTYGRGKRKPSLPCLNRQN
jgi:hypothetical protein